MDIQSTKSILSTTDAHLNLKMLDFLSQSQENKSELLKMKIQQLQKTRKFEELIQQIAIFSNRSEQNEHFQCQMNQIDEQTKELLNISQPFLNMLQTKFKDLENEKFSKAYFQQITQLDQISNQDLMVIFQISKSYYDAGQYQDALNLLNAIQNLVEEEQQSLIIKGKLHCFLLLNQMNEAKEELKKLKILISTKNFVDSKVQVPFQYQLQQVSQLVHLYLFTVFEDDQDSFIQLFQDPIFEQFLISKGQHLYKYLISAMLLQKNFNFQQITETIERNLISSSDSLVNFIKTLFIQYDFKECQSIIPQIKKEISQDYFLNKHMHQITENAQHLFFYVYFKMQKNVKIETIAQFLGLSKQEAEIHIVNFMSHFNIKAKIDSVNDEIIILRTHQEFYEDIQSKIRDLLPRTTLLANNLQRIIKTQKI